MCYKIFCQTICWGIIYQPRSRRTGVRTCAFVWMFYDACDSVRWPWTIIILLLLYQRILYENVLDTIRPILCSYIIIGKSFMLRNFRVVLGWYTKTVSIMSTQYHFGRESSMWAINMVQFKMILGISRKLWILALRN